MERFNKLDKKKKERIISASLQVFSVNNFKNALTDDIARKAEISKGSLFQYFKNKISLYLYLYNYSLEQLGKKVEEQFNFKERDYFELVRQSILIKITLFNEHRYLYQFIIKANEEKNPVIAQTITEINQNIKWNYLQESYQNVDYNKFKEGIDIGCLFKMIEWCSDGIWKEGLYKQSSVESMCQQAIQMIGFFKQAVYKAEYLN